MVTLHLFLFIGIYEVRGFLLVLLCYAVFFAVFFVCLFVFLLFFFTFKPKRRIAHRQSCTALIARKPIKGAR